MWIGALHMVAGYAGLYACATGAMRGTFIHVLFFALLAGGWADGALVQHPPHAVLCCGSVSGLRLSVHMPAAALARPAPLSLALKMGKCLRDGRLKACSWRGWHIRGSGKSISPRAGAMRLCARGAACVSCRMQVGC